MKSFPRNHKTAGRFSKIQAPLLFLEKAAYHLQARRALYAEKRQHAAYGNAVIITPAENSCICHPARSMPNSTGQRV
ncbi:MAG: hypothetical protein ACLUR9_10625 [Christensenellales bacterium]